MKIKKTKDHTSSQSPMNQIPLAELTWIKLQKIRQYIVYLSSDRVIKDMPELSLDFSDFALLEAGPDLKCIYAFPFSKHPNENLTGYFSEEIITPIFKAKIIYYNISATFVEVVAFSCSHGTNEINMFHNFVTLEKLKISRFLDRLDP
jgi:hypothetical protein